jgi:hypothetical protein
MTEFMRFLYSNQEVPTEFLLPKLPTPPELSAVSEPEMDHSPWSIKDEIKNLTGLEPGLENRFKVRKGKVDLAKPKCRHRTISKVFAYSYSMNEFSFSVITEENPSQTIGVEFFQVFKLNNAKDKFRELFNNDPLL